MTDQPTPPTTEDPKPVNLSFSFTPRDAIPALSFDSDSRRIDLMSQMARANERRIAELRRRVWWRLFLCSLFVLGFMLAFMYGRYYA